MAGLHAHTDDITGIIAVTDSGRSTGKVRIALDVPAPGDIRNAIAILAEGDPVLRRLFSHRFETDKSTELNGMAFGNLFLAALAQQEGSFLRAVEEAARLLSIRGKVLPVTLYKRIFLRDADVKAAEGTCEAIDYLGGSGLDVALLNDDPPPSHLRDHHAEQGMRYLDPTAAEFARIEALGVRVAAAPVIDKWSGPRELWKKQDTIRHDATRLSDALMKLMAEQRPRLRAIQ